jgi:hypothetical protein
LTGDPFVYFIFARSFSREKSPAHLHARVRAVSAVAGLISPLKRHKMLCLNAVKIMPVTGHCQDFRPIFYGAILYYKTMSYQFFCSKYFKKQAKKTTLL